MSQTANLASSSLLRSALGGDSAVFTATEEVLAFVIACAICSFLLMYTKSLDVKQSERRARSKNAALGQPLAAPKPAPPALKQRAAQHLEHDISRLLRAADVRGAAALLLAQPQPELGAYKPTLFAAARAGEQQVCMELLEHMRTQGVKADAMVYNSVMTAAAKSGSVSACEALLRLMQAEDCEPNAVIYATLIHACAKASRLAKAEFYYEQMVASGILGDRILYNTLIHAAARAGDITKAEKYLRKMTQVRNETQSAELKANVVTYTALITAAARTNDLKKALQFLDQMRADGIMADRIALNAILHLCARLGDAELGMKLFDEMTQGGAATAPDAAAYRSMLRLWTEKKNQKKAVETVLAMRRLHFSIDRQSRERACNAFPHLPASTWWD